MNRWTSWLFALCLIAATAIPASAFTTDTLQVPSAKMKKDVPVTVLLPDAYQIGEQRFPVFYLLHGATDSDKAWGQKTTIGELADQYGFIVVCPDGGYTGWWFDSPEDPTYQYETFVSSELIKYIDGKYRTRGRWFRAVGGNSMGGHGALFLAIRHPDEFPIAVGFSGGYDLRPYADKWDIAKRIGTKEAHPERWEELSVVTQAKTLTNKQIAISFECGVDDFFIENNRALHQLLLDKKIDHEYTERPGGHGWVYWKPNLEYQVLWIVKQFGQYREEAARGNYYDPTNGTTRDKVWLKN